MDPAAAGSIVRAGLPLPAGAAGVPMAMEAAGAAAPPAPPAWTRLSARLVWVLAAALFLLGCAEAGLALFAMILPAVLAAIMAVAGPAAWEVVVLCAVMGTVTACLFPAHGVLGLLLVDCDSVFIAFHFWFFYVVLWPVAAIVAVVALKWEAEDRRPSTSSY